MTSTHDNDTDAAAPDVDQVIGGNWPLHGPYSDDHTLAAGAAMSELTRYLNYATGQGADQALPFAATLSSLVGQLSAVLGGLDQTFRQLTARLGDFKEDPNLYDHAHPDDPWSAGERVGEATTELANAQLTAGLLYSSLQGAQNVLARLGHRDTVPFHFCRCVVSCADDPATACSLSGTNHVHPDDGSDTFGRCPVHPDAPGDL